MLSGSREERGADSTASGVGGPSHSPRAGLAGTAAESSEGQTSSWGRDKSKASQSFSLWVTAQINRVHGQARHGRIWSPARAQQHWAGTKGPGLSLHEPLCPGAGVWGRPQGGWSWQLRPVSAFRALTCTSGNNFCYA